MSRLGAVFEALFGQVDVDLVEQRSRQIVVLQRAAALRSVGHRLARKIDVDKVAQRLAVMDRVFQRFAGWPYYYCSRQ